MVTIDGSYGEGGGQILRTSLALSLVTGKPFSIRNIRAGRKKPGLMRQHLTAVNAAAEIGQAAIEGNRIGSQAFTFEPEMIKPVKAGGINRYPESASAGRIKTGFFQYRIYPGPHPINNRKKRLFKKVKRRGKGIVRAPFQYNFGWFTGYDKCRQYGLKNQCATSSGTDREMEISRPDDFRLKRKGLRADTVAFYCCPANLCSCIYSRKVLPHDPRLFATGPDAMY